MNEERRTQNEEERRTKNDERRTMNIAMAQDMKCPMSAYACGESSEVDMGSK